MCSIWYICACRKEENFCGAEIAIDEEDDDDDGDSQDTYAHTTHTT